MMGGVFLKVDDQRKGFEFKKLPGAKNDLKMKDIQCLLQFFKKWGCGFYSLGR